MTKRKNANDPTQGPATMKNRGEGKVRLRGKAALLTGAAKKRHLNILKGEFTIPSEFSDPLPEEELKLWGS